MEDSNLVYSVETETNNTSLLLKLKGKIALLVPTFNSAKTIAETLESLQDQGDALELFRCILIADGGSDDKTVEIARKVWRNAVPMEIRVTYPGRGEALDVTDAAFSLPPEVEWLFLMHSDNVAKSNWISIILGQLASADARVASVCSSYDGWFPDGTLTAGEDEVGAPVELICGNRDSVRGTLFSGCWWHHSTAAIRIQALRQVGGYLPQFRHCLDWDLLLRLLEAGWNICYIRRSLVKYRQHPDMLSNKNVSRHLDVREALVVVRKFQYVLSMPDLLRFHAVRQGYLVRRIFSSCARGQVKRFFSAVFVACCVPLNYLLCIRDRAFRQTRFPCYHN